MVCAALPSSAEAGTSPVNWEREAPSQSPSPRTWAASAYDSGRDRVVMFAGTNSTTNLGDTWEWDGTTWTQRSPAQSPPALAGAAMAYDGALGTSVLFGGSSPSGVSSDTWEWNGSSWTRLNLAVSPPPMVWTAMVYDSTRSRLILFGALNQFGLWVSETWEFDGTAWTQEHPASAPSPRQGPAMAFDSSRNRTVLFGGRDTTTGARQNDTWEWDGTAWSRIATAAAPYARSWHSMAFDPVRNRTILFGGDHIQPFSLGEENDTWEWDGAQWTRDWTDAAPSIRAGQSMVWDTALGRIVLFGGFNAGVSPNTYSNETWELGTGINTPPGSPALNLGLTSGEFGSVDVGDASPPLVIGVVSSGTGPAATTIATTGDFEIASTDCPSSPNPLAAGSTCQLVLAFSPTAPGDRYGTLTISGNLTGGTLEVPLHGFGIDRDFTISVNPSSINTTLGFPLPPVSVTSSVIGDAGTIALSALTNDPGITASFSPSTIAAGTSSTMAISIAPTVAPGFYGVSVVGTEGAVSHRAEISIHIFPVPDFTIASDQASVTLAHGTGSGVALTSTAINGAGSITLSAAVTPAGPTVTLDPPYMTAGGIGFVTIGAGFGVTPGSYIVTVTGTEGDKVHSTTIAVTVTSKGLVNGGFESGDLSGWSQAGIDAVINYPHGGTYAGQVGDPGSPVPFAGDSTLTQTFDVPASGGKLVFWYRNFCSDKPKDGWFTATLVDGVTGVRSTLVSPVCVKKGAWTKATVNLSSHAGNYVTVTFLNHQGTTTSNTFTLVDDVGLA
jgi:hypothetical protein